MRNRLAWRSNEAEMNKIHLAYLSLGSNIQPRINLVRAIELLQNYGKVEEISNAWESKSVGAEGPNYLNACISFTTPFNSMELKGQIIRPIEEQLGRKRSGNRFAPRTIDIDIVLFDDRSCDEKYWDQAFVVIPLAEIHPDYQNPVTQESTAETATRLLREVWMEARQGVLSQLSGSNSTA